MPAPGMNFFKRCPKTGYSVERGLDEVEYRVMRGDKLIQRANERSRALATYRLCVSDAEWSERMV